MFEGTIDQVFGLRVLVNPALPLVPDDGENARRIVRHGLADVLRWLGEDPGRAPFEETHAIVISGDWVFVSQQIRHQLWRGEKDAVKIVYEERVKAVYRGDI